MRHGGAGLDGLGIGEEGANEVGAKACAGRFEQRGVFAVDLGFDRARNTMAGGAAEFADEEQTGGSGVGFLRGAEAFETGDNGMPVGREGRLKCNQGDANASEYSAGDAPARIRHRFGCPLSAGWRNCGWSQCGALGELAKPLA